MFLKHKFALYIFSVFFSFLSGQNSVTSIDLIEFQNKLYLADSYTPYSGELKDYHSNGMIKTSGNIYKGVKVGDWKEFYENGSIKIQKSYFGNKSIVTYFDQNQLVLSTGYEDSDKKDGKWVHFNSSGQESHYSFYSKGLLDSTINLIEQIIKIDSTALIDSFTLADSLDSIDSTVLIEQIIEINEEVKDGEYVTNYDSGRYLVENYKNGVLHGSHIVYHENGFKSIDRLFVDGDLERKTYQYNDLGVLVSKYHEYLNNDNVLVKNGEYISFYTNGMKFQEGVMISGYRYGLWKEYDNKGNLIREINYDVEPLSLDQEYIETLITTYYPNGNKSSDYSIHSYESCDYSTEECNSILGYDIISEVMNGEYKSYYSDGQLKSKGVYLNDNKIELWIEYFPSGSIKSTTEYVNDLGYYASYYENNPSLNKKEKVDSSIGDYSEETLNIQNKLIDEGYGYLLGDTQNDGRMGPKTREAIAQRDRDTAPPIIYQLGYYKNSLRTGEWSEYNINKEIVKSYNMIEDKIDINHPFVIFYESSEFEDYKDYNRQKKVEFYCYGYPEDQSSIIFNGLYKKYFPNKQINAIGVYKENNQFGEWIYYFPNGAIKAEVTFDEYETGGYRSYYESGELYVSGRIINGLREGKWNYYYKNQMKEWVIFYLHGKVNPNQRSSNWYENGYKKTEGFLLDFENSIVWDNKYIEYYDDGIILVEGYYSEGKKHGKWIEYHPNRSRKSSGDYSHGKQVGDWNYYNQDGVLVDKKVFN